MGRIPELDGKKKICYKCGSVQSSRFYVHENVGGYLEWECNICHRDSPYSHNSARKSVANWRNKNVDPYSKDGKGFIGEMIVASTLSLKNCNIELDNFHAKFDVSPHDLYGKIQVKTATLIKNKWDFSKFTNIDFDTVFLVCMDGNIPWKNVERIYAIPVYIATQRTGINIYKTTFENSWHKKFRIDEISYNNTFHNMKLENCPILKAI